jgi:hypothetical protein
MYCHLSGEQLGVSLGIDGGSARRLIREAKKAYPDLDWFGGVESAPKVRKGIAVFDLHHPKHDKKLWRNILKFTEDLDPDIFVFGGDNQDLEVVSHWVGNKRQVVEGKRLKKDYAEFNRDVLDPLEAILRDDVERVFHLGNHEDWIRQYIQEHPEMEGLIELEEHLHLDGWRVLDYGKTAKYGHLHSMHGTYTNIHNAMKTAQVYGRSIMYGHGHTLQTHTLVTPMDSLPYAATQIPCACHMNPSYALNRPNAWTNGFAVMYIQPNGCYNLFPVVAIDGVFAAPNGIVYE